MKKAMMILTLVLGLTACAAKTEMPANNGTGADQMRKSPCACVELDYDGRGFEWVG